jgi:hypothetical protein
MPSFLRGHVEAFEFFGGVPRVLLYDNLKSAVLERAGDAIRFHPTLLALAGHYRYEPRPVAPARGNEKGRVERAIRYVASGGPPRALLVWPGLVSLTCVVTSLEFRYEQFGVRGEVLVYRAQVNFEEIREVRVTSEEMRVQGSLRGGM